MILLRIFIRRYPRIASALAFGLAATGLIYLSWIPGPMGRMEGFLLASAAGLTHALAGILTGRKVIHPTRSPKFLYAGLWGGGTSFLALLFFAVLLTVQMSRAELNHPNPIPLVFFTFIFAFLGADWALVLMSAGIGCGLHQLAVLRPNDDR